MRNRVLIIDDDPVNNFICKELIKMVTEDLDMEDFTRPEESLEFISKNYKAGNENVKTFLLLDLNMNRMTGWEFLEEFYKFDKSITDVFSIYILSSSLDGTDRATARQMPLVKEFLVKPLTIDALLRIFNTV
jgi:response regulator RpfG family c-di-GMP phosphodiesterase